MDEEFKENFISDKSASYEVNVGQRFVSKKLDEEFIRMLSENIDTLDSFNDPFAREIVKSIDENQTQFDHTSLPFSCSSMISQPFLMHCYFLFDNNNSIKGIDKNVRI